MNPPDFTSLKNKQRSLREGFNQELGLRVHRAISWGMRSEKEGEDPDIRFILLWIGFNSVFARIPRPYTAGEQAISTRKAYQEFFDDLVLVDGKRLIETAVWNRFSQEIRLLLDNKYIYPSFWHHQHGSSGHDSWNKRMKASRARLNHAMGGENPDTATTLSIVFERLYTLRNQLMHGGATWNSDVNRQQVHDGEKIMSWMLPIFVDLMMDNPDRDWGEPFYPKINEDHQ